MESRRAVSSVAIWLPLNPVQADRPLWLAFMTSRSEEHTSELQSLMRISYAVFCLKKKTSTTTLLIYTKHASQLTTIIIYSAYIISQYNSLTVLTTSHST